MKIFVTGTDTDVGKTVASAWLINKLSAAYWKPVQSGIDGETDRQVIQRLSGLDEQDVFPCTYELSEPLSPHEAARRDGVNIELEKFSMPSTDRPLIVEGAGGVLVPLNDEYMMIDLMAHLGAPAVLVCRSGLGTINHTLLSLSALRACGIDVLGVIVNGPPAPHNVAAIKEFGKVDIIAEIPHLTPLTGDALSNVPGNMALLGRGNGVSN